MITLYILTLLAPSDWITLFSAAALIIGWFINSHLNRKNEIAKKRAEIRIATLKSFSSLWYLIQQNKATTFNILDYKKLLKDVREDFYLYGETDEIELFEKFVEVGIGENFNADKATIALNELRDLVRIKIRKELNIN